MNPLRRWMLLASTAEQECLALTAGTSRNYLYQVADGRRSPSADMAARIEQAAHNISKRSKGRLPVIKREKLCKACALCPYSPKCKE